MNVEELDAVRLLELLQESPGRAEGSSLRKLANGDYVVVTGDGVLLWGPSDCRKWIRGSLQRSIERSVKKREQAELERQYKEQKAVVT
jgi:hypothetical protein